MKYKRTIKRYSLVTFIFTYFLFHSQLVIAQDCKVFRHYADGTYMIKIGDKSMLAVTEEIVKEMLQLRIKLPDEQKRYKQLQEYIKDKEKTMVDLRSLTIGQIVSAMKISELWGVIGALLGLLGGAFVLGYKIKGYTH